MLAARVVFGAQLQNLDQACVEATFQGARMFPLILSCCLTSEACYLQMKYVPSSRVRNTHVANKISSLVLKGTSRHDHHVARFMISETQVVEWIFRVTSRLLLLVDLG